MDEEFSANIVIFHIIYKQLLFRLEKIICYFCTIVLFRLWIFREVIVSYPAVGEPKFAECLG